MVTCNWPLQTPDDDAADQPTLQLPEDHTVNHTKLSARMTMQSNTPTLKLPDEHAVGKPKLLTPEDHADGHPTLQPDEHAAGNPKLLTP